MGEADTLTGVEAVDDHTLKVTLEYPQAEFITFVGNPVCAPVPKEEVESAGESFSEMPVGNGPYTLKEWKHDQELTLDKNEDYYGEEAKVDQVIVKIIPDPSTSIEELKAGNIDAVKFLPPGMDEALRNDDTLNVIESDVPALQFASFNMSESPWSDNKALREAFNYAVDVETIANVVLLGQATAADGIVPPTIPGHQPGASPYSYDPEMAKTKLEEAGYPNGEGLPPITLTYPNEGSFADVALVLQSQLKDIGVEVELVGVSFGQYIEQMLGQQLSFFVISWNADYPSPDTFLYTLFHSDLIGPGGNNVSQYTNEEVDALLDQARSTTDTEDRLSLYNEAEKLILEDAPIIPVVYGRNVMAYSDRVSNFVLTSLGELALNEITVSES
jgi:ABC-type transport system substrate-binding protein